MEKVLIAEVTPVAINCALEAGELLKKGFGTSFGIQSKEGNQNLVTDYDFRSQELILNRIRAHFPSHHLLSEEDPERQINKQEVVWIVDPLDGTVNFAHSIPFFAVSIGVALAGQIIAGVVYNPLTNELFIAQKGLGATGNGRSLAVSKTARLRDALMATGFPYDVDKNPLHCIERLESMLKIGIPIRRLGVASLDLAYVAAGRFDAFWEVGLHAWDMAAGKLLIEEAGGRVSHYDGSSHRIFGYLPTVATNGYLHAQMVEQLKGDR